MIQVFKIFQKDKNSTGVVGIMLHLSDIGSTVLPWADLDLHFKMETCLPYCHVLCFYCSCKSIW